MGRLDGRIALVTGGARGIGRGIARVLAREGADVAIGDVNVAGAEETAALLRAAGRRALAIELDVTSEASAASAIEVVPGEFGRLDVLVNNAGWLAAMSVVGPSTWGTSTSASR